MIIIDLAPDMSSQPHELGYNSTVPSAVTGTSISGLLPQSPPSLTVTGTYSYLERIQNYHDEVST